jgi:hypothetical protein
MSDIFPHESNFHAGPRIFRRLFPAQRHTEEAAGLKTIKCPQKGTESAARQAATKRNSTQSRQDPKAQRFGT